MDINEILLSYEKREQYEKERNELLDLLKQKIKNNEEQNKYLYDLVKMSDKEFNNIFYKTKESILNKKISKAKINSKNHASFVSFILTLFAILFSFLAGIASVTFTKSLKENSNMGIFAIIIIIFLVVIALILILIYRFSFHRATIRYSKEIENCVSDCEDLKINDNILL